ncbi:lipid kinase, partial [Bacillus subtilis]
HLCRMALGKHTHMDGVTMCKARGITFYTKDKIPFHADGEIMATTPFRLASSPSPLRSKT